ncbi:MAG: Undecaprenyl-phosphate 4-deoxy-4-formamido-L-arabinose transferase [Chroococcopsis gigantea SAG 12.99]|nr:glycosyltransferase [Chlorogloea purpurea SAG 13.99]MDV3002301.1 Undecaprenyl-phosphate 4-deoxy-4-formamido-L-arabinose transferase [Chroococcopsis gigantea SAG 12.99]
MFNSTVSYQPTTSVIIPVYNGEKDLPALLQCLGEQTYPRTEVEYIFIDNNSTDRTAEILQETVTQWQTRGLKLITATENNIQSSYAARNRGIKMAIGEILAFTDADCRPTPDWLTQLVKPFIDPRIGIVAGEIAALTGGNWLEQYAERNHFMCQQFLLAHPFSPYGQTANLGIRKETFRAVGLFRPYLTTGGDADICWRILRETHWQLTYAPRAIVHHRHRSTLKELKSQLRRYGRSNRYLHQLYGVELMKEFTAKDLITGLGRWLLKDLPKNSVKFLIGKGDLIDLINTPVNLIGFQSRSEGQKTAILPDRADFIDRLSEEKP